MEEPATEPLDRRPAAVLTIAGSDSGGGAGIQADLKAFARCGVHGMTAITAITAQNTLGVQAVEILPAEIIIAQVEAVIDDIGVDAVKVGMLADVATIETVAAALDLVQSRRKTPVVVDPVMVAESGSRLLADEAVERLSAEILPRATVVTPNIPEARALTGLGKDASQAELARSVLALGSGAAIVTGGHSEAMVDLLCCPDELVEIPGEIYPGANAHGSGCTHSSLLAARLALGDGLVTAARFARAVAAEAVRDGLAQIGSGAGPVNVLGIGKDGV